MAFDLNGLSVMGLSIGFELYQADFTLHI